MGVLGGCGIYKLLYKILYNICIIIGWDMYGMGVEFWLWTVWILLTFGVDFRVRIRLLTGEYRWK